MLRELATDLFSDRLEEGENLFHSSARVGCIRQFEVSCADCLELAAGTLASIFDQAGKMRRYEVGGMERPACGIGVGKYGRVLFEGVPQCALAETSKMPEQEVEEFDWRFDHRVEEVKARGLLKFGEGVCIRLAWKDADAQTQRGGEAHGFHQAGLGRDRDAHRTHLADIDEPVERGEFRLRVAQDDIDGNIDRALGGNRPSLGVIDQTFYLQPLDARCGLPQAVGEFFPGAYDRHTRAILRLLGEFSLQEGESSR